MGEATGVTEALGLSGFGDRGERCKEGERGEGRCGEGEAGEGRRSRLLDSFFPSSLESALEESGDGGGGPSAGGAWYGLSLEAGA